MGSALMGFRQYGYEYFIFLAIREMMLIYLRSVIGHIHLILLQMSCSSPFH